MKRKVLRALPVFCAAVLLFSLLPATNAVESADTAQAEVKSKDETVYVKLDADGSVRSAHVVSSFDVASGGWVTDYGPYEKVTNLTSTDGITLDGQKVTFQAEEGRYYYQGDLGSPALPWLFEINYTLDGSPVTADELAGADGRLEMTVTIRQNPDADSDFFDSFMLQSTVTLDAGLCSDIVAGGGIVAAAGQNRIVTFTTLPGNEAELTLSAQVHDFEMQGMQISALPMSLDIASPDTAALVDSLSGLEAGVSELNDGAAALSRGAAQLRQGSADFRTGLDSMSAGAASMAEGLSDLTAQNASLSSGSKDVLAALQQMSASLTEFTAAASFTELIAASGEIASAIDALHQGTRQLSGSIDTADASVSGMTGGAYSSIAQASTQTAAALQARITALGQADAAGNAQFIAELTAAKNLLEANGQLVSGLDGGLAQLESGAGTLSSQYATFNSTIASMPQMFTQLLEGLNTLKGGVDTLEREYAAFDRGLGQYLDGTARIGAAYRQFYAGFTQAVGGYADLHSGILSLGDGAAELASGTGELDDALAGLDGKIEQEIDNLLAEYGVSDAELSSFASPDNGAVELVQFVVMTPGIETEKPAEDAPADEDEPTGFWARFLALFGL